MNTTADRISTANTDAFQRKFHNWRALTAELLSQANRPGTGSSTDDTQKNLRRLAQKVIQVFKSWAINPTPDILIELEVTLYNTYCDAVNSPQLLCQQRASWSIKFPQRNPIQGQTGLGEISFDPSCRVDEWERHEDRETQELLQQYVEFVITPALSERGMANGDQFDVEYTFTKASVLMYVDESSK